MSTPRFYCAIALESGGGVVLPERTFHHAIRVRRMRVGESLVLFAGDGREARATLTGIRRDVAEARIESIETTSRESTLDVTLLQGISSGDRMDYTLRKAVELGVHRVVPVMAERSQGLGDARAGKRVDHWRDIAISACEQSGRNTIPPVGGVVTLDRALASVTGMGLLLSGNGVRRLRDIAQPGASEGPAPAERPIVLLAGPEGGLTDAEETLATEAGYIAITLGPRILRTETAAVAALAAMQALWGDG